MLWMKLSTKGNGVIVVNWDPVNNAGCWLSLEGSGFQTNQSQWALAVWCHWDAKPGSGVQSSSCTGCFSEVVSFVWIVANHAKKIMLICVQIRSYIHVYYNLFIMWGIIMLCIYVDLDFTLYTWYPLNNPKLHKFRYQPRALQHHLQAKASPFPGQYLAL